MILVSPYFLFKLFYTMKIYYILLAKDQFVVKAPKSE